MSEEPLQLEPSFDELAAREFESLLAIGLGLLRNRDDALEVAQETLTRAFERWTSVSLLDRPGAWTRRVALNLATDRLRGRGRRRRLEGRIRTERASKATSEVEIWDGGLWDLVAQLPARQRNAIVLFYVLDLSTQDVALTLGVPEGTVKSDLGRARTRLREQLGGIDAGTDVDGAMVWITPLPGGDLEAMWTVDEATQGYVRSRGFDEDMLVALISALVPRPVGADIAGFDLAEPVAGLEMLHEALNTSISGSGVGSICKMVSTGLAYRVWVPSGDPIYLFVSAIDRPKPIDVEEWGDSLVFVSGTDDPDAPTASQVMNADQSVWQRLVAADGADAEQVQVDIGQPFALQLDALSSEIADQTFTATITRESGVFFEVETGGVSLDAGSRFWVASANGRGGISGAASGGVLGYRVSDDPNASSFPLSFSAVDEDGLPLQSTGLLEISLAT